MSKAELEKRYGIQIVENGYYDWKGRYVRLYDMYSADGCCWEKGLHTMTEIHNECKEWRDTLLSIKNKCKHAIA